MIRVLSTQVVGNEVRVVLEGTAPTLAPPPVAQVKRCGEGPCKHFQVFALPRTDALCRAVGNGSLFKAVPADGSGFCHLHSPAAPDQEAI